MPASVPKGWKEWVRDVLPTADVDPTINSVRSKLVGDSYEVEPDVKAWLLQQIDNELRRRMDNVADAAGRAENEVYASLPQTHREFLDQIEDKTDMGLINILRNNNAYQGVSEQGAAYFRVQLRHELRRRGINPDSETEPSQANVSQDVVPNYEIYDTESGQVISQFRADTEEEANRKFSEFEQNYHSDSDFNHEYRAIGPSQPAAAQTAQPTATQTAQPTATPAATDGPGMWMVGNHTYGRETFRAGSRDAAIQAYADRNDISVADLTADRSFVAQLTDPDQGQLDLREMRRLAGLK
jgi:hypothetical protein